MALVTFITRPLQTGSHWDQIGHSLYWTLSKPIFIAGMIMTVLPSILGIKHSFFNLILNAKSLSFIARISFCTYLVHYIIIGQVIATRTYDIYFSNIDVFTLYLGMLVISLFFGFVVTLTVELPFSNLLKMGMKKLLKNKP